MARTKKKSTNKKNPLYVVTNNGKDVEQAESVWDAVVKKMNLQPAIDLIWTLLELLAKQVNSYAALVWLQKELENINSRVDKLLKTYAPWMYFYNA
jgi:hypothetical protein